MRSWSILLVLCLAWGCIGTPNPGPSPTADEHAHHHHEHVAPHGGTLVVLGEEFAHLEFVLDPKAGRLDLYLLGGEAETPVRSEATEISLKLDGKDLSLKAVANELTGEKVGDTSQFQVESPLLKGVESCQMTLPGISVLGRQFEELSFPFPEGNESHGSHEHESQESHEGHDTHQH